MLGVRTIGALSLLEVSQYRTQQFLGTALTLVGELDYLVGIQVERVEVWRVVQHVYNPDLTAAHGAVVLGYKRYA